MIIALIYAVLVTLLLWIILYAPRFWQIKCLAIISVFAFSFLVGDIVKSTKGWPITGYPPRTSMLIGVSIDEPDQALNDKGAIYLWAVPAKFDTVFGAGYRSTSTEPRAYKIPYSRQLHQQLAGLSKLLAKGKSVFIKFQRTTKGVVKIMKYNLPHAGLPPKKRP